MLDEPQGMWPEFCLKLYLVVFFLAEPALSIERVSRKGQATWCRVLSPRKEAEETASTHLGDTEGNIE